MKFLIFTILPAALANIITADVLIPEATPTPKLFRRTDTTCLSSVFSELMPPTPSNSLATIALHGTSCTLTAPLMLSSPVVSYVSVLKTYISTIESKAKAIKTDCGATSPSLTLALQCPSAAIVLVFTDSTFNRTSTSRVTVPVPIVATSVPIGGAAGIIAPQVSAALFIVFTAVFMLLQ